MAVRYSTSQIIDSVESGLEHMPVGVPGYDRYQTSTIVTGKRGIAPGELDCPRGIAVDEATHQIFVVNCSSDRVEIFSEQESISVNWV